MQRRRMRFEHLVHAQHLTQAEWSGTATAAPSPGAPPPAAAQLAGAGAGVVPPAVLVQKKPRDMSLRDWAIYLLHNAAEIEHALLIQYLYASYSLDENAAGPSAADPAVQVSASSWRLAIQKIAIEEMGHLLTVQNVLRFVGGAISFDRQDFPIPTDIYPFPFQLEPLTKDVLAKYVYAEMPEGDIPSDVMTAAERTEVETRAKTAAGVPAGQFANHVGTLYATLVDVLKSPEFTDPATSGFPGGTEPYQAKKGFGWTRVTDNTTIVGDNVSLKGARLLTADSIGEAIQVLEFVARQGEASDVSHLPQSHFGRFWKIYREFPDATTAGWAVPPARPVATNPSTIPQPITAGTITQEATQLWARLFDLRYRILLASLAHATAIPRVSNPGDATPSAATAAIVEWIYGLMARQSLSLATLGTLLTRMPRSEAGATALAGAPFTMPFALEIPDRDRERWQHQLDLLDSSAALVAELKQLPPNPVFPAFAEAQAQLDALLEEDGAWRLQVQGFL